MRTGAAVMCCAALLATWGCQPQPTLVPRTEPFMPDVPVPAAFKFDPTPSTDFSGADPKDKVNNYFYKGRAPHNTIVEFYRQQMPVDGWRLQQEVGAGGQKKLFFRSLSLQQRRIIFKFKLVY